MKNYLSSKSDQAAQELHTDGSILNQITVVEPIEVTSQIDMRKNEEHFVNTSKHIKASSQKYNQEKPIVVESTQKFTDFQDASKTIPNLESTSHHEVSSAVIDANISNINKSVNPSTENVTVTQVPHKALEVKKSDTGEIMGNAKTVKADSEQVLSEKIPLFSVNIENVLAMESLRNNSSLPNLGTQQINNEKSAEVFIDKRQSSLLFVTETVSETSASEIRDSNPDSDLAKLQLEELKPLLKTISLAIEKDKNLEDINLITPEQSTTLLESKSVLTHEMSITDEGSSDYTITIPKTDVAKPMIKTQEAISESSSQSSGLIKNMHPNKQMISTGVPLLEQCSSIVKETTDIFGKETKIKPLENPETGTITIEKGKAISSKVDKVRPLQPQYEPSEVVKRKHDKDQLERVGKNQKEKKMPGFVPKAADLSEKELDGKVVETEHATHFDTNEDKEQQALFKKHQSQHYVISSHPLQAQTIQ